MEKKKIYRLSEVAQILSLSPKTLRGMFKEGKIRATRQGRLLCVLAEDLEAYFDTLRASS